MKHCPNPECPYLLEHGVAAEFEDRVEKCVDCGAQLVAGPAPAPSPTPAKPLPVLTVIRTVDHPTEADLIKARLEAAGIPVFLKNYETINANWLYANALGGIQVVVREEDAPRARQILDEEPEMVASVEELPTAPGEDVVEAEVVICPRCGSTHVHYEKYNYRLFFLSMLILSLPLPFKKGEWVCEDCGYRWKDDDGG